jgi:serine/threonine-protein kinase
VATTTPTTTPTTAPAATDTGTAEQPAAPPAVAYLNINSIPPSSCFLDGRPLGNTPRPGVQVTPGSHTVRFVNSELGLTKTIGVTVGPGETKLAAAKLN